MVGKKVAIIQSNYIPWKGYFDIINSVDLFIFYDDVQYTKNDWRNRNRIKTPQGSMWLTVPVSAPNRMATKINEVKVCDQSWRKKHWRSLEQNYCKANYFMSYRDSIEDLYLNNKQDYLSELNISFILAINGIMGINTELAVSSDFILPKDSTERLVELCKATGASEYISGPSAANYINLELFKEEGIKVTWFDNADYPEYPQLYPPFEHKVSVVDLMFNMGPDSTRYMKSFSVSHL